MNLLESPAPDNRLARYQQVRDAIVSRIASGEWAAGAAIPTETELASSAGVAVGTVRKAVDLLAGEGVLVRAQGRGTFVRRPTLDGSLFRFFRMTDPDGKQAVPRARILSCARSVCPARPAQALGLREGQAALRLDRLRLDGAQPLLIEEIWLALDRFAPLLKVDRDAFGDLLYPLYERLCGEIVASADESLTVEACAAAQAKPLGLVRGTPVVVIERLARGYDRHPIEWRRSHGPADRFRYSIEIR